MDDTPVERFSALGQLDSRHVRLVIQAGVDQSISFEVCRSSSDGSGEALIATFPSSWDHLEDVLRLGTRIQITTKLGSLLLTPAAEQIWAVFELNEPRAQGSCLMSREGIEGFLAERQSRPNAKGRP